jgi:L-iditol 2-dehydrogenase
MKALIKSAPGKGNISLTNIPIPTPDCHEVLIKVHTAGVCGTDIHLFHDRFKNSPPFVMGHEFSGIVENIGSEVEGIKLGDRVVSANNPYACGVCKLCQTGYPNLCSQKKAMGIHSDGCFAEFIKLPANLIHRIPDNVDFEDAALMEPLAVAVHSVSHRCKIEKGDVVVVFGPGTIGLLAAQVARAEGAAKVILAGITVDEAVRFECAKKLGIQTINVQKENLADIISSFTGGIGADVVVEASGSFKAITSAISLLRRNGRLAVTGLTGQADIKLKWDEMVSKGISVLFTYSSVNSDWRQALNYLSEKKVLTQPLITHRFTLEKWEKAFQVMEQMEAIKPVFNLM